MQRNQKMNEQLTNNPEYLEHHPDAVMDADKAHVMANVSDYEETEAVAGRRKAENLMSNIGKQATYDELMAEVGGDSADFRGDADDIRRQAAKTAQQSSENYRSVADRHAQKAARMYGKA